MKRYAKGKRESSWGTGKQNGEDRSRTAAEASVTDLTVGVLALLGTRSAGHQLRKQTPVCQFDG